MSSKNRPYFWAFKPARNAVRTDSQLLFAFLGLLVFGLIFTYSSSAFWGDYYKKDSLYFFKRQLVFAAAGCGLMAFFARYYQFVREKINPVFVLCSTWALLFAALFFKPVAHVHRWIPLGPVQLQPSELAKIALMFYLADYLDKAKSQIVKSGSALARPLAMTAFTLVLIGVEPDLGTPILMLTVVFLVLFVAGARLKTLFLCAAAAVPVVIFELFHHAYRIKRLMVFLSPEKTAAAAGYQLNQSFLAVGSGGWFGEGLGASKMKLMYLPAPHTDFIFSVISEELGLLRTLPIIAAFCFILIRGIQIAKRAEPYSNSMMALGITLTLTLQAFLNMAVSLGLLPTKGLPLPFFSYGGSSILATLAMAGILLNISASKPGARRE